MSAAVAKTWFTITEAAELAACSRDTIKRYLRSGKLRNARQLDDINHTWEIPLADLVSAGLATSAIPSAPARATNRQPQGQVEDSAPLADQRRVLQLEADLRVAQAIAEERAEHIADLQLALSVLAQAGTTGRDS